MASVSNNFVEFSVHMGSKLNFFGMEIKISEDGKAKIGMKVYIQEVINMFGQDVSLPVV